MAVGREEGAHAGEFHVALTYIDSIITGSVHLGDIEQVQI